MAQQKIVWSVLPHGRVESGNFADRLRVSIVASPRLTPQTAAEQTLQAFPEWENWPETVDRVKFRLHIDGKPPVVLERLGESDPNLWKRLLPPDTPVAGFVFKDMSRVNLHSYAVRNVLGLMRRHYGSLAVQAAGTHPTLLPWNNAHPGLKGMLRELGTRTTKVNLGDRSVELPLPGFDRFFDEKNEKGIEKWTRALVFGPDSIYKEPIWGIDGKPQEGLAFAARVLPPDWNDPAGGGGDAPLMSQFSTAAEYTLYQANRFYRRTPVTDDQRAMRRPDLKKVPLSPKPPEFDFHRIVASYADYPELLRALGLVIDCILPPDSPIDQKMASSAQAQAHGIMGLEPVWSLAGHNKDDDHCPRTAWWVDKERFVIRERTGDHQRGMLRLAYADDRWGKKKEVTSPFDVYQVDPDGAALKTADFLLSAQNLVAKHLKLGADGEVTYTTGDRQPVAALRSAGLGISRHGRAAAIAQSAATASLKDKAIQSGPVEAKKIVLFAEDVLRGYRVDVQAIPDGAAQKWRSLCSRQGDYRFSGSAEKISLPDDEGYVKGASATSSADAGNDPDDHYLHESMFRWTGWSLVVPRPGRTLRPRTDPDTGVQGERAEEISDEVTAGGNGLSVSFKTVKGSLPRLRFGTPYRLRARVVDLAGNSLSVEDQSLEEDPNATLPVIYWRFEPVDPPALLHRARISEGESLERMVIRSNWQVDPAGYLVTPLFSAAIAQQASADFEYTAINERHVVPPKSSQLQCEQHGTFDWLFSDPGRIKDAYAIAARESGTLYDAGPKTQIELVTPASVKDIATTKSVPLRLPSKENPTGDRIAPGQYLIHREAQVETPYLPDPAAGGVGLRAMPGHAIPGVTGPMILGPSAAVVVAPNEELVLLVAHAGKWPDTLGFRIVLQERKAVLTDPPCKETFADDGAPRWDEEKRVLTLFVAKGRVVRLRYASFVHKDFIDAFGLPDWVDATGEHEFVRGMAMVGCTWMIAPYRALTLVHATQQPVCEPAFLTLTPDRRIGDPHAMLIARLRMHGPSTGKFEIEAEWEEWVDDMEAGKAPERITSRGQLGEVLLGENHVNQFSLDSAVLAQMHDPANRPRAQGNRHEFGDTKFRLIRYRIRATTRFREYLPEALYAKNDQVTRLGPIGEGPAMAVGAADDPGAPVLRVGPGPAPNTVIPASAPPDEPRPLYTVPTFRWQETPGNQSLDTTRLGNGLRVWLERPWFSSGDGELLGVVIYGHNRNFTDIPSAMVPLVTQWGLDPIWDTALPKYRTRVSDFTARVADEPVELQEVNGQMVHVVGHRVHWNADRSLWHCDIELDPGRTYMPFVRLALVRYQPNALSAAKISKVVLGEFAQVLPRRRATFKRQDSKLDFTLRGFVPDHGPMKFPLDSEYQDISFIPPFGLSGETGRNRVELVLQTRDPALNSDLAWSDSKILASNVVAPASNVMARGSVTPTPPSSRPTTPATLRDRLATRVDLSRAVNLSAVGSNVTSVVGGAVSANIVDLIDPAIWKTTVTLPDTGNKPARVAVREYERYYTDRTISEKKAGSTHLRRVVEERLVYTTIYNL